MNRHDLDYILKKSESLDDLNYHEIKKDSKFIALLNNSSESYKKELVNMKWQFIRYIKSPSIQLQMMAIFNSHKALGAIKKPHHSVVKRSITLHTTSIQFVKNPSYHLQEILIKKINKNTTVFALPYIANPISTLQKAEVLAHTAHIKFIRNPSQKLQNYILENESWRIGQINNASDETIRKAMKKHYSNILKIQRPSKHIQMEVVKELIKEPNLSQILKLPTKSNVNARPGGSDDSYMSHILKKDYWSYEFMKILYDNSDTYHKNMIQKHPNFNKSNAQLILDFLQGTIDE